MTSRRSRIRVSVIPVDLGPLEDDECSKFIELLRDSSGLQYLQDLSRVERMTIGRSCDGIPLAIRWTLARSKSASEALDPAEAITRSGRTGEELLEFSFRRVFETMTPEEQAIVQVLSLFNRPLPIEAILIGASSSRNLTVLDCLEQLFEDAVVQRFFDSDRNDYVYTLIPMARTFIYDQVSSDPSVERVFRTRLQ